MFRSSAIALGFVAFSFACTSTYANLSISNRPTQNMDCSGGTCVPTAKDALLNARDLESDLSQFGNVRVMTTGNGLEANNIVVNAAFTSPDSTSLTLDAHGAVRINAAVSIGSGTAELQLQSGSGGTLGNISFGPSGNITFGSTSDLFNINGGVFQLVASLPALAAAANSAPSGFYVLTNSYDASADGTYRSSPISAPFSGYFEALGNTISGMKIKADAGGAVGLFAHLTGIQGFGVVRNLRLTNASVKSSHASNMGGIAGFVEQGSIISQSSVTGEVKAGESSDAGGVAGFINFGTVTSSRSSVNVAVGGEFAQAGGLVGAFGDGTLKNSYATGAVAGGDESETGGLVGYNGAPVADSFATGAVRTGAHGEAGGLVGHNGGRVKNSYAEGDVSATGVGSSLGGLMGRDEAGAVASYSTGKITGVSDVVGGVVGTDCSGGGEECRPGGYRNTDWNTTTSELSQGAGNINDDKGLQSLTSHKLRSGLPQGFSEKVWTEQGITNRGFPYLINNPPPQ